MKSLDKLKQHNEHFHKSLQEVSDGVWIAIGYAVSNVSVVRTTLGLVVVDTTESTAAAANILAALRNVTDEKVAAIIYTHGHRDHVGGASVFAKEAIPEGVRIYARENLKNELAHSVSTSSPDEILRKRATRQFGMPLAVGTERINLGIGPADRPIGGLGEGFLTPTDTFSDEFFELEIGGRVFHLMAAPGETMDQMMVWMPAEKIVFAADNFYHSFPNLYAIRGTMYRDFEVWANTLDKMQSLRAHLMLTGHGQPVVGEKQVAQCLGDYRDAIRFIVKQSVIGMNRGMTPDELVAFVTLPEPLKSRPYLQEFYGTVQWSVRAFYSGKMGWFDGNPTHLFPLSEKQQSERLLELMGAVNVLAELDRAMQEEEYQWALHLTDWLLHNQDAVAVKAIRIQALRKIADQQMNAPARNYYLTCAYELKQSISDSKDV